MTTIAWDGKLLAADAQMNNAHNGKTRKIFVVRGELLAFSGTLSIGVLLRDWYAAGADPEKFPKPRADSDWVKLMVIRGTPEMPTIWLWEDSPVPFQVLETQWAIGSGSDYAISGMALGLTARQAINHAHRFDPHTGECWDTLSLNPRDNT